MAALDLFWFDLDAPAEQLEAWRALLSPGERQRAERFLNPEHGRRFTVAHARLREILGRHLGRAPESLAFEFGPQGKPTLAGGGIHFNLSHSGNVGLVGLHPAELGVDVEAERPHLDGLGLARRFFTPRETAWLEALPPAARPRGFARLWTCKEAWIKADGRGLALPLDQVEVAFSPAALRSLETPPRAWFLREIELRPGFAAAVVQDRPPDDVTLTYLPPL